MKPNKLKLPKNCCPFHIDGRCIHKNHLKRVKKAYCIFSNAEKCPDYRNTNSAAKDAPEGFKMPLVIPSESIWNRIINKLKREKEK